MSRLTERQSAGYDLVEMKGAWCDNYCAEQSKATCKDCAIWKAIQKLAYYEDLEEQGRLIEVVTCKDCKYYKKDTSDINNPYGICEIVPCVRYENEYCSTAERKLAELKGTEG